MSWNQRIQTALQQRHNAHQWRQPVTIGSAQSTEVLVNGQTLVNFCSNDYLGLANCAGEDLAQAALQWGLGSGASHLVCGHSQAHQDLEKALATLTGYPRALLFSTGYMANMGCINAFAQKGDLVLEDRLNHASLIDGAQLSRADFQRYQHLDYDHLQQRLQTFQDAQADKSRPGLAMVVTDSIFSMDGDLADIRRISALCQHYNALLMVDDAHGLGVIGNGGAGVRSAFDLTAAQLPLYVGTLGKAVGGFGAFIAADEDTINYLIQFARPYIYTTALPPAVAAAMTANLERLSDNHLRQQLNDHIGYFRQQALAAGLDLMDSHSPIQPLMVGDESTTLWLSQQLKTRGLWVTAIRPPTVPEGSSRLRITLTATHTRKQIDQLLSALIELTAVCPQP
jgi:8-amino-7-oxononanoate synthase